MYNLFIWLGTISIVLILFSVILSIYYLMEDNNKMFLFFNSLNIILIILSISSLFLTYEIDKIKLITTYKIYNIKEQATWDRSGKLKMYYILDTQNGRYKINNADYKLNGKMILEVYQKYCRVGKIDGEYYYIINK